VGFCNFGGSKGNKNMEWKQTVKVIASIITIIGILLGFLEYKYQPHSLLLESSPDYPEWIIRFRLLTTSVAPL
jgi:hypothetical protein